MGTYQDEAQYDFGTRSIPQAWWTTMYRDVLNDLKDASRIVTANTLLDPVVKDNQLAIIDVLQVYTYKILVNTFGDIPYTEALDPNNLFPKYDDAKTVYADLLKRLAADLGKLKCDRWKFYICRGFVYAGNVGKWITFTKYACKCKWE